MYLWQFQYVAEQRRAAYPLSYLFWVSSIFKGEPEKLAKGILDSPAAIRETDQAETYMQKHTEHMHRDLKSEVKR